MDVQYSTKMAILSPIPALDNLKITLQDSSLIFPSHETPKQSMFLSNIDQIPNFNVQTVHFFKPNPDFPPQNVANILKIALEKVLVQYDFMAGRLKLNHEICRLEVDCNAAGVGFIVASSELGLEEIGQSLIHPNLGYRQLAVEKLDNLPFGVDQPLNVFQVTSFKCGGFSMGMSTNHTLFDGISAKIFLHNLASQAFDDRRPLAFLPCNNRRLLAARSPPLVKFPHPEFLDPHLPFGEGSCPPMFDCPREELHYRIFKMSADAIAELKKEAKAATSTTKITTFAVAASLIWRCKAFSDATKPEKNSYSSIISIIDIRARVNPPLPVSYTGNGVAFHRVSATFEELENGHFSKAVDKISEGAKVVADEHVRSALDWLEVHRGVRNRDYIISSWLGLGFEQVEYPWGKPVYCCPVVIDRKDTCWVFRDGVDGGVAAMVALPAEEMERFESSFKMFFE